MDGEERLDEWARGVPDAAEGLDWRGRTGWRGDAVLNGGEGLEARSQFGVNAVQYLFLSIALVRWLYRCDADKGVVETAMDHMLVL